MMKDAEDSEMRAHDGIEIKWWTRGVENGGELIDLDRHVRVRRPEHAHTDAHGAQEVPQARPHVPGMVEVELCEIPVGVHAVLVHGPAGSHKHRLRLKEERA